MENIEIIDLSIPSKGFDVVILSELLADKCEHKKKAQQPVPPAFMTARKVTQNEPIPN